MLPKEGKNSERGEINNDNIDHDEIINVRLRDMGFIVNEYHV